jgi:hypothetical protein
MYRVNALAFLSDDVRRLNADKLATIKTKSPHSTEKGYLVFRGVKKYYKSKWEMNYAHYLEWLLSRNEIVDWQYEPETFWFEGIRRGTTNYTPDFKVTTFTNGIEFHEVKGYMDPKSKVKLARMKKYHPEVKMVLIQREEMKAIGQYSGLISGWR